jgi:hypothetical protein
MFNPFVLADQTQQTQAEDPTTYFTS